MIAVDAARPSHCAACGVAAHLPGKPLQIYGHGKVDRQARGPVSPGALPEILVFWIRRYLCRACAHVMRVGPSGVPCRRLYSGAAIAWALALCVFGKVSQREVRKGVCPWGNPSKDSTWKSLGRWLGAATMGRLWRGLQGEIERVLQTLSTRAVDPAEGSILSRVFCGAAHVGREEFVQNLGIVVPTEGVRIMGCEGAA